MNNLNKTKIQIKITQKDANLLFTEIASSIRSLSNGNIRKPNIISIDPFGTPNLYLDSAFKAIQNVNGLMCVTATDTAVLFGVRPNVCIRKYLAKPLHTEYCKEVGARILIYFISLMANINKMGIIPLLTFYSGHFLRIFCLTFKNKKKISNFFKNYGYILHCRNCGCRSVYRNEILKVPNDCPKCNNSNYLDYAGPLWINKIHDLSFLRELYDLNEFFKFSNKKRIEKLLSFAIEEINLPVSYYNIHTLCQQLKLSFVPKIGKIINLIKEKGYQCSRTHFDFLSIKTDMDLNMIKDTLVHI